MLKTRLGELPLSNPPRVLPASAPHYRHPMRRTGSIVLVFARAADLCPSMAIASFF